LVNVDTPRSPTAITGERGSVWTVVVGCFGVALVVGSMVAFNTALGDIAIATSATQTQLNWIVDGYTVVLACLLLPAGAIGDRHGRRATMLAGLALFSVASAAPAIADTPTAIIVARMLAGLGAAFVMPATLSMLSRAYPPEQRTKVIGIWAGVAGSAGVAGLVGSGVLLSFSDWKSICWALAACGLVVLVAASTIPSPRDEVAGSVDWVGAALVAGAVGLVVFALLEAPTRGWTDVTTIACLLTGAVAAVAFVITGARQRNPLLDPTMFRNPQVAASAATITAIFAATFGFFYLGMQYAQLILGYSALTAAMAFAPFAIPLVVLSLMSFRYAPRWGLMRVLVLGLAVTAAGFLCMLALEPGSSYLTLMIPTVIIGAGIGLSTAPATSTIMLSLQDERQGVASAINDTTREVGAALGIAVAGSVLAQRYTSEITPTLSALPEPLRRQIADGFGMAMHVLDSMGPQAAPLVDASQRAFVTAMHSSASAIALLVAASAVVVAVVARRVAQNAG
jgi:EmrB/QacA subfamily drug resistance transporter